MKQGLLSSITPLLSLLVIVAIATGIMLAVRWYIVEPEPIALACAASNSGWRCLVREYAVLGFLRNVFGMSSLIAAVLATVAGSRWLALLAILSGVAGAVLYTFELSGVGLLLGALVWVRHGPGTIARAEHTDTQSGNEQQA
jgi:hypothetical protein